MFIVNDLGIKMFFRRSISYATLWGLYMVVTGNYPILIQKAHVAA